jgi:hypothetical protein
MPELRVPESVNTQPPPPYITFGSANEAPTLAELPSHSEVGDEDTVLFNAQRQQLLSILVDGLKTGTPEAWAEYWIDSERRTRFFVLFANLRAFAYELAGDEDRARVSDVMNAIECHEQIELLIPELGPQLTFIERILDGSIQLARQLIGQPVPEESRQVDNDLAARFNWSMQWAVIGLNSLLAASEVKDTVLLQEDVLAATVAAARMCALEANHLLREGQRLRRPTVEQESGASLEDDENVEDDDESLAEMEELIAAEERRVGS